MFTDDTAGRITSSTTFSIITIIIRTIHNKDNKRLTQAILSVNNQITISHAVIVPIAVYFSPNLLQKDSLSNIRIKISIYIYKVNIAKE